MKKRIQIFECDACGRDVIPYDDGPHGYEGAAVTFRGPDGGTRILRWFACSEECITKAVTHVVEGSYQ